MQLSSISLAISRLLSGAGGLPPPPPSTDPYFDYVTLLLNTSATNGAQNNTFLDSSTNNFSITRNGDTTQGSFNPYMPSGYWSGFFDGTGDYLQIANTSALNFDGQFCVEGWVNFSALNTQNFLVSQFNGSVESGWLVRHTGTNLRLYASAGAINIDRAWTPTIGVWYHFAVTRDSSNNVRMFVDGSQIGTTATSITNNPSTGDPARVGGHPGIATDTNAYLSNIRVVKGSAVYTGNFTPPTTPLTAITNTSLLCLQDNRFIDNSTNAFAITRNGDTRISKFAPFNPPASYSTASYGGSGYFDGTGDYLTVPANAVFQFGTGDFTIECWVNKPAAANGPIVDARGSGVASPYAAYIDASNLPYFYDGTSYTSSVAIVNNQWNHVAFVRTSGTLKIFVNGVEGYSAAHSTALNPNFTIYIGGQNFATPVYSTGYVSNLRVVKGTAVYTANFTPPTTPLTAITNTSLLLNFTNAGIFDAATINDGQTVGNAQVSTTQAKWPPTGISFDGTGDYIPKVDRPELRLGTGDFTIEGWVYLNAAGVAYGLVSKGTATTGWSVNVTSGNKLQFSYTATQLTGATSLVSGTWYYFAVVRSGTAAGNLRVILNGSTDATSAGAVNDNFNQTNVLYVGADRVAGAVLNGYLQDVRITNGYARTTSTPTAAFPTL
jgi:glucan-binding YG repeat protein